MRQAAVFVHGILAGVLEESSQKGPYTFRYQEGYEGAPVSLTMPLSTGPYIFEDFPPFFEGVLPEGIMLDALLRSAKLDKHDRFGQLVLVGNDLVGAVTVHSLLSAGL